MFSCPPVYHGNPGKLSKKSDFVVPKVSEKGRIKLINIELHKTFPSFILLASVAASAILGLYRFKDWLLSIHPKPISIRKLISFFAHDARADLEIMLSIVVIGLYLH